MNQPTEPAAEQWTAKRIREVLGNGPGGERLGIIAAAHLADAINASRSQPFGERLTDSATRSPAQEKPAAASVETAMEAVVKLHGVLHEHDLWGYGYLISAIEHALGAAKEQP